MRNAKRRCVGLLLGVGVAACFTPAWGQRQGTDSLARAVSTAFESMRDGWSSDEVLLQDDLLREFVARCQDSVPDAAAEACAWKLLTLRKAGKLSGATTRRGERVAAEVLPVAEYTARHMEDKFATNMDRVICAPELRAEFDRVASKLAPGASPYAVRKAAFGLRKARRLRPELLLRIADWNRRVLTFDGADLLEASSEGQSHDHPSHDPSAIDRSPERDADSAPHESIATRKQVPEDPGVYILSDESGYLYIGESKNLQTRLAEHASNKPTSLRGLLEREGIDWKSITVEVHAFATDSRMRHVRTRRAYESELIDSRKPRFNVRP